MEELESKNRRAIAYNSETKRFVWYSKAHETAARAYFEEERRSTNVLGLRVSPSCATSTGSTKDQLKEEEERRKLEEELSRRKQKWFGLRRFFMEKSSSK